MRNFFLLLGVVLIITGCNLPQASPPQDVIPTPEDTVEATAPATARPTFTLRPTYTATATMTPTPTPLAVTWNLVGLPDGAVDIHRILVHPADENLWFVLGHPGSSSLEAAMYRTTDAGASWETVYSGGIMWVVEVDPHNPDILYASDDGKLLRSVDFGETWSTLQDFGDVLESVHISAIDGAIFAAPRLYGDDNPGIYRSMDGGDTWERFAYGAEMINFIPWDIEEDPNTGTLYVVIELAHHPQPYDPPFYRSTDRGETWEEVGGDLPWHGLSIQVDPFTSDVYYLTEGSGLFKSSDQGRHWRRISPGENFASGLLLDPASPPRLFGGDLAYPPAYTGGVYYSDDGGESFVYLGLEDIAIADLTLNASSTLLYVVTYSQGIYTAAIPAP